MFSSNRLSAVVVFLGAWIAQTSAYAVHQSLYVALTLEPSRAVKQALDEIYPDFKKDIVCSNLGYHITLIKKLKFDEQATSDLLDRFEERVLEEEVFFIPDRRPPVGSEGAEKGYVVLNSFKASENEGFVELWTDLYKLAKEAKVRPNAFSPAPHVTIGKVEDPRILSSKHFQGRALEWAGTKFSVDLGGCSFRVSGLYAAVLGKELRKVYIAKGLNTTSAPKMPYDEKENVRPTLESLELDFPALGSSGVVKAKPKPQKVKVDSTASTEHTPRVPLSRCSEESGDPMDGSASSASTRSGSPVDPQSPSPAPVTPPPAEVVVPMEFSALTTESPALPPAQEQTVALPMDAPIEQEAVACSSEATPMTVLPSLVETLRYAPGMHFVQDFCKYELMAMNGAMYPVVVLYRKWAHYDENGLFRGFTFQNLGIAPPPAPVYPQLVPMPYRDRF